MLGEKDGQKDFVNTFNSYANGCMFYDDGV